MLAARRGILAGNALNMTEYIQHDDTPIHPSSFVKLLLKTSHALMYLMMIVSLLSYKSSFHMLNAWQQTLYGNFLGSLPLCLLLCVQQSTENPWPRMAGCHGSNLIAAAHIWGFLSFLALRMHVQVLKLCKRRGARK